METQIEGIPGVGVEFKLDFQPLRGGLTLLLQAHEYAEELSVSSWDFAVEISLLRAAGMTNSDLRWLACKNLLEHAHEVERLGNTDAREFQETGRLTFTERTCFVLTETGVDAARQVHEPSAYSDPDGYSLTPILDSRRGSAHRTGQYDLRDGLHSGVERAATRRRPFEGLRPEWDRDQHELRLGGHLIKVFRLPSPNQESVLTAFEEEGWPIRVDDPLTPVPEIDPKQRLHDTIKGLNRNQKNALVRFRGDGTGEGVLWSLTDARFKP